MFLSNHFKSTRLFAASAVMIIGGMTVVVCGARSTLVKAMAPKLNIAKRAINLGLVPPSEMREVSFPIENKGMRRLVLNEIGCGCGDPLREAILIPPGKTVDIVVTLDSRFEFGIIEKIVGFTTNDPAQTRIDLTVLAIVNEG